MTNVNEQDRLSVENRGPADRVQGPVQAIDVRPNLGTDPWTDLRGGHYRFGEVTRVGLVRDGYGPDVHGVALTCRCDDGTVTIAEVSLAGAVRVIETLMNASLVIDKRAP